jgi:hypothetical protein
MQAVRDKTMNPGARPVLGPSDGLPGSRPDPLAIPGGTPKKMPGDRPQLQGAVDAPTGAPMTPPPGKRLPKAGSSTPGYAKDDKRFE